MDDKLRMLENLSNELIDAILTNDLEKQFAVFKEYQKHEVTDNE